MPEYTTLGWLRKLVGKALGECVEGSGLHPEDVTPTTVRDPDLPRYLGARRPAGFDSWWLSLWDMESLPTYHRVTDYDPATGTLTFAPAKSWTDPASYELHQRFSPDELNRFVNDGLARCSYLKEEEYAAVPGKRQYTLMWWVRRPSQVVDVFWRVGDEGYRQLVPVRWFQVRAVETMGNLVLDIDPTGGPASDTLVVRGIDYYGPLSADDAQVLCPIEWAVAAALVEAYRALVAGAPAQDVERYERRMAEATVRFRRLSRRYAPRPALRLQR